MSLRIALIISSVCLSSIAVGQDPGSSEQSIFHHIERIRQHADSLERSMEQATMSEGIPISPDNCDTLLAENSVLQGRLEQANAQFQAANQARIDEASSIINLFHSNWRFAAEDWVVFVENIELMRARIDAWNQSVSSGELLLDPKTSINLVELSSSLAVMDRAVVALAQPSCYFDGIDDELKASLRGVVVSMRDGAEVIVKLLEQAKTYREFACSSVKRFGIMSFEDAMKGFIFGEQFDEVHSGLAISFNVSQELAESTALEPTDDLILNEERVKGFTWLNQTMFEATFDASILETVCPQ